MTDMADSIHPDAIPADAGAVAGYIDGAKYPWPADAWATFAGRPVLRVSVLADPEAEAFDSEPGNAGVAEVATAVAVRVSRSKPSVVYTDETNLASLTAALAAKGTRWLPASSWPEPGPYLWAAAPGTTPGDVPTWCPVEPVAVQDRWESTYDLSTLRAGWLPPVEPVAPSGGGVATSGEAPSPPAPTYLAAPDSTVRFPKSVSFVPTPTLTDALDALAHGKAVYVWTTAHDEPVGVGTADQLRTLEHTGDPAFTQYVTFTAEPVD